MFKRGLIGLAFVSLLARGVSATIFGAVHGTVRDAAHHAVAGARITVQAEDSAWQRTALTDAQGVYDLKLIPLGRYELRAEAPGLAPVRLALRIESNSVQTADLQLRLAAVSETIDVSAGSPAVDPRSSTTRTSVSRVEIEQMPGADQSNSLAVITNFVPGSYVVHDQLHVRGGHQVDWLIDGVPVPNTNIASNVGPQFDPKDIGALEVQRGGYSAEYGDRTYAVFNVVPRNGFERNDEGQLSLGAGEHNTLTGALSLGNHTERVAYYLSANANRSDSGLEPPVPQLIHDGENGGGLFGSLILLPDPSDQLRIVASARHDSYEIPNDEELEAANTRDREREHDAFVNVSWLRTLSPSALLTVAPFFHDNRADFEGGPDDEITANDDRRSRYAGLQSSISVTGHGHDARAGLFAFHQSDEERFGLDAHDGSALSQQITPSGHEEALFAEDAVDVAPWLTLRGGLRWTKFSGTIHESATSPRLGAAARLPWLGAVLRASYGQAYQAPPLATVSGPLLALAVDQGFGFLPLRGERDRQYEIGVAVPLAGLTFDASAFRTEARNFFDHDALGNSNIFFPLTIDRAHIHGYEATLGSPAGRTARFNVVYSHQTVEGEGAVTGGLTDFTPPEEGRFFLDHDQRDTLVVSGTLQLPHASWISANLAYGSGFLNGDGPDHLPGHTTFDLGAGTSFGAWSAKLTATNVTNRRYRLDLSNTFGGTHYVEPRKVLLQLGWRFKY